MDDVPSLDPSSDFDCVDLESSCLSVDEEPSIVLMLLPIRKENYDLVGFQLLLHRYYSLRPTLSLMSIVPIEEK